VNRHFNCRLLTQRAFSVAALRALPRRRWRSFEIYSLAGPTGLDLLEDRVGRALDLIAAYDPRQLRTITTYVRRFGIEPSGGDRYDPGFQAHVVSKDWLAQSNNTTVALNIVHEATHARLAARSILNNSSTAARIEAVCVRQEVSFARHLPGDQGWIEALARSTDDPWWTPEEQHRRREQRLRGVGAPGWLIRLLLGRQPRSRPGSSDRTA